MGALGWGGSEKLGARSEGAREENLGNGRLQRTRVHVIQDEQSPATPGNLLSKRA